MQKKEGKFQKKLSYIFIIYSLILKYKIELDYNKLEGFLAAILKILSKFVHFIRVFTIDFNIK
jgi:hypothetical protein